MLHDLRCHWLVGHSSALLVGSTKGERPSSLRAVGRFISESIAQVERNRVAYNVTVAMTAFKNSAHAMDLFQPGSTHTEVELGSSPVFGPAIVGVTNRIATTPADCVKLFEEGMSNLDDAKELVVAFFVLKQVVKGSSGAETVYLSSLAVVVAGEDPAQLSAVREKHRSVPFTLLRYAVGGGSAAVCLITVPGDGAESSCAKAALGVGASMRKVRNSPPRSGNVRNFVTFAEGEVQKQKERAGKLDDPEKKAALTNLIERIETMLKDALALLSKPMETEAKIY
ncbi:hypothetical protein ERJ75_000386800 [Trypanosoma vivax]|nr:hypothetical protein ERJ75_000386800 [Trypanosoma vivax]